MGCIGRLLLVQAADLADLLQRGDHPVLTGLQLFDAFFKPAGLLGFSAAERKKIVDKRLDNI